jgi:glutamyl-tRNA synthetase
MELFNVKLETVDACSAAALFDSESYEAAKSAEAKLIHWVPVGQDMPSEVVMSDASIVNGIAEGFCKKLKPDTIIQFERFGFVRIDNVKTRLIAYYAQK